MIIDFLTNHPDVISELANWYRAEWEPYYGTKGQGDARADLEARCCCDKLPIGLVAIEDHRVVATVAVGLDAATNLTPSIIGLLVKQNHRGRGIGTALIQSCTDVARQFGYERLYVSTSVLGNLLHQLGWQALGETKFLNDEQGSVFVRDL